MTDYTKTAHAMTTKLQEFITEAGLQNNYGLATDKLAKAVKEYLDAANRPTYYEIAQAVMDSNTESNCIYQVREIERSPFGWSCHGVIIRKASVFVKSWNVTPELMVSEL